MKLFVLYLLDRFYYSSRPVSNMLTDREITDAIGSLCDGIDIDEECRLAVIAAMTGVVKTLDRGMRLYYVDLDTMMLGNVDTAEGVWSVPDDGLLRTGNDLVLVDLNDDAQAIKQALFPLMVINNPARMAHWREVMQRANNAEKRRWAKFVRRALKPLLRAWHRY